MSRAFPVYLDRSQAEPEKRQAGAARTAAGLSQETGCYGLSGSWAARSRIWHVEG